MQLLSNYYQASFLPMSLPMLPVDATFGALVLTRKTNQKIIIGRPGDTKITVQLKQIKPGQAKLLVRAPQDTFVIRGELKGTEQESTLRNRKATDGKSGFETKRMVGQFIEIGEQIKVTVLRVKQSSVKLNIDAPPEIPVHREEIFESIARGETPEEYTRRRRREKSNPN